MKKFRTFILIIFACNFLLNSCRKNYSEENFVETITPVFPDFTTQVSASVHGFITDENGNAVEGAIVKGSSVTTATDNFGYFNIEDAGFAKSAGFVQVTKAGYFSGYKSFIPVEGKEIFVRLQLIQKLNTGNIDAATGGMVSTSTGANVSLPPDAVLSSSGTLYTGTVNIAAHWLDPSDMATTQLTMPGDLRGVDSAGHLKTLTTFGMMAVELTGAAGEPLQIAGTKKATLTFPIPSTLTSASPSTIPLWSFDEAKGVWKEEGIALRTGNTYVGDVSHFSFWNCDVPNSLVNFSAQLLDLQLNPLANIAVSISIAGQENSARTDYTDANGNVSGMIPANSNLVMNISVPCNASVFIRNLNTSNADVFLGSIKIDLQQYGATFQGTVTKCNGSPVTDGYVILSGGVDTRIINISDGVYIASGTTCANSNAAIIAFDNETSQQSNVLNVVLTPGLNSFANLSACTASPVENITYVLDGVTTTLSLPQHLFQGNYDFPGSTTALNAIDLLNGSILVFNIGFAGPASPGFYSISGNNMTLDRPYQFLGPTTVSVSAYGLIGEFITCSFNGSVKDLTDDSIHTFSCTINIRRDT